MDEKPDYSAWSHENLVERVTQLEKELNYKNQSLSSPTKKTWKKARSERAFDPSKYNTRLVAFKLAYLGKKYNGFEYHAKNPTPLPTIEEELWKALNKARLIFPAGSEPLQPGEINWEGTEYSKCGRTDKGVSAFGQVIAIRVRSKRPLGKGKQTQKPTGPNGYPGSSIEGVGALLREDGETDEFNTLPRPNGIELASPALQPHKGNGPDLGVEELDINDPDYAEALNFDPIADELPYCQLLNRVLPPDIRILAWCPAPPLNFSARFSCRERRYRYFFTQPAFSPIPRPPKEGVPETDNNRVGTGWLDIEAMREAAKAFEGLHDFRNFCKVDGGKQIYNFERRVYYADIEEVDDYTSALAYVDDDSFRSRISSGSRGPKVYTFTLHGSAFLWHQVRHMAAILFLVGQGLEKPSLVSQLLDVKNTPRRPTYEMAIDTPLVLWDCIFPQDGSGERKDALQWHYVGDGRRGGGFKYGPGGVVDDLWKNWRETKVDEVLAGTLLGMAVKQGDKVEDLDFPDGARGSKSQKVFDGGDMPRLHGVYTPVMKKPLLDSVEVINEKYLLRKGWETAEEMKEMGYRRPKKTVEE